MDRSTSPPSLLAGEYSASSTAGRLHRWPLSPTDSRMLLVNGRVTATEVLFPGTENMQGGLTHDGAVFVSASGDYQGLWAAPAGQKLKKLSWPDGPEDLHLAPTKGNLWCATEHPGKRWVFAVKADAVISGCD